MTVPDLHGGEVESTAPGASDLERRNAEFWDELCGSWLARQLGLVGRDPQTLEAFDRAYLDFYPYLLGYLDRFKLAGRRVLEIGLGYGTLGQAIIDRGAEYHGLDIATGPVRMMQHRLALLGTPDDERIVQGSATAIPFSDGTFDFVYSIGCLHHTGDLAASIEEVRRVLMPGGTAVVMLYNANSARQLLRVRLPSAIARLRGRPGPTREDVVLLYDANGVPHTDFVSRRMVRGLFSNYAGVRIETQNLDDVRIRRRRVIPRRRVLGTPLAHWLGLDLYIVASR